MAQIILVRPGATNFNDENRIQGTLDVPLNREGTDEVERIAEGLSSREVDAVYAPSCQPAFDTAKAIATALDVKLRRLDRMRNLDFGLWQGMLVDEVRRKHPRVYRQWQDRPESICPPEGETLPEAAQRIEAAMAKLIKRHKEETFVLVLPEPIASLVRYHFDQAELGDLWKANQEHGQWETFEIGAAVETT